VLLEALCFQQQVFERLNGIMTRAGTRSYTIFMTDADLTADAPENELPLPPATFEFFVLSLKAQAEMAMGLLHFGDENDRPKPDFRVARHTIDLLALLEEKTKGNLSYDEQRLLGNSVTELRFRFVQMSEKADK